VGSDQTKSNYVSKRSITAEQRPDDLGREKLEAFIAGTVER